MKIRLEHAGTIKRQNQHIGSIFCHVYPGCRWACRGSLPKTPSYFACFSRVTKVRSLIWRWYTEIEKGPLDFGTFFFSRRGRWSWDMLFGWNLCFSGREKWETSPKNARKEHPPNSPASWRWLLVNFLHKLSSKRLLSNMCYVFQPKKRNFLRKWSSFDKHVHWYFNRQR